MTHIDPTGKYIETALDVAGLAYDANAFRKNHSLENGAFLLWSAAAVVLPIVPGSYIGRAVKVAQIAKNAEKVDKAYALYQGFDAANKVRYVGITFRKPSIRFAEHIGGGGPKAGLRYKPLKTGLSKGTAHLREQGRIDKYGLRKNGGQLYNKINSIRRYRR